MKLSQLFSIYPQLKFGADPHREITNLTHDSLQVEKGSVFIALRGASRDGHDFLPQACAQGAIGLVVEDEQNVPHDYLGAILKVENSRNAMDRLAAHFYGNPADSLFCVGVTGTNGKTSVTYMVEAIFEQFGWKTGVMGTIDHHLKDHRWASHLTTPDPLVLQKRLREFKALDADAVAFEVSSHALHQRRVDAIPFDVAVFTNLTRDHLDYHKTMEDYFAAKERLFFELLAKSTKSRCFAIVNADDVWSRRVQVADRARVWTYGQSESDFRFTVKEQNFSGSVSDLRTPRGNMELRIPLPGEHNIYNAVASLAVGLAAGASLDVCQRALAQFRGVPGRLERVKTKRPLHVFVDYAHTDDALRVVLRALREVRRVSRSTGRIITVFGCGGDRDRGKRPLMAQAATEGSDLVFVTSDNPRTEVPEQIIKEILSAVPNEMLNKTVFSEVDRRTAIARALQTALDGDVILIAGKGHENYQIIGHERIPFSDVLCIQEIDA